MTQNTPQTALDRDLVALVGSRIAHDLISPLGAIGNGLELLALSGLGEMPELALISESVDNANHRIRLFRLAFGAARPGQSVPEAELRALLDGGLDGRRLALDWQPRGDQPRGAVKLALLALQCLDSALPWGGAVQVTTTGETWEIVAKAERMNIIPHLWALLTDPQAPGEVRPAEVHFALAGLEARAQGRALAAEIGDTSLRIRF